MASAAKMKVEDLVDMTAMVDIVFFVLIFFMSTSMQGVFSAIKMPTPNSQSSTSHGRRTLKDFEKADYIVVRIDRDNVVWLNDREIPSEHELLVQLRAVKQGSSAANKLLVLGNSEAKTDKVVEVLDAGCDAGMDEMQLAVDDES
jgi:biopolymer transport protein ExbD